MFTPSIVTTPRGKPVQRSFPSSRRRAHAFALALPIPILVWSISSYVVASQLFSAGLRCSLAVSGTCALLIFCVERLVMLAPRKWYVSACRVFIALLVAVLGASAFDLCLFGPEIEGQIRGGLQLQVAAQFDQRLAQQRILVEQKKSDWVAAEAAKNCEANGSCGSHQRDLGKIWLELDRQARLRRQDYVEAEQALDKLAASKVDAVEAVRTSPAAMRDAGLLARIDALHQYTGQHPAARTAWLLLFLLMVAFESMVVFVKIAFGTTVDDDVEQLRERLDLHRAQVYFDAHTTREGHARALVERVI